jgi:hypothetical protein
LDGALWAIDFDCRGIQQVCVDGDWFYDDGDGFFGYVAGAWYPDEGGCDYSEEEEIGYSFGGFTTLTHELKWTDVAKGNGKNSLETTVEIEFKNLDESCS